MSEEEKEAIESLNEFAYTIHGTLSVGEAKVILNLIQKQQHRLEVANEYIESRIDNMIPEHYDDLKYILNECDLDSTW